MANAGYNPQAFLSLAQKIFNDKSRFPYWRSHPMDSDCIQALQVLIHAEYPQYAIAQTSPVTTVPNDSTPSSPIPSSQTGETENTHATEALPFLLKK